MTNSDGQDPNKAEMGLKKLMSVTKSKFYLLKVTYPKLYEMVSNEETDVISQMR